jgi:putative FmdB family regulatory protein
MPIYEYACTACGERTEARQGFDDPPLETCPICGGKLRKLYSPVGIVFKGSGFYATEGRRSAGKGSEKKDEKKSTTSSSDKSETKETKKDTGSSGKAEKSA